MEVVYNSLSTANFRLLESLARPAKLMKVLGVEMRNQYNAHFTELGRPYSNLVQPYLVNTPETDDYHASIHIVGLGGAIYCHKLKGGTITPKTSKYLAIPLTSKAKKWGSPKEKRGPEMFVTKRGGNWFLQERSYVKKVRNTWKKIKDATLHYVLKKSVTHKPDTRAAIAKIRIWIAINDRANDWFNQFRHGLKK